MPNNYVPRPKKYKKMDRPIQVELSWLYKAFKSLKKYFEIFLTDGISFCYYFELTFLKLTLTGSKTFFCK
jgi:hypothetical protein